MTAGNQPSTASVNQTAGSLATQLRNIFSQIQQFNAWIGAQGNNTGLIALGFSSTDAGTIVSAIANLSTLAGIYQGQASGITLPFNFMANTETLWGGQ